MGFNHNDNLYKAVSIGNGREVFKSLLKGANLNYETDEGLTPLTRAILNGHDNIVEILLEAGADPNWEVLSRGLPFDIIINQSGLKYFNIYLELNSTAFSYSLDCPNSPLYLAIAVRNLKSIELLLKYGARANYPGIETSENTNNIPPIIFAILTAYYQVVEALLPAIKHIDEKWGKNYETPLMVALNINDIKIARLLIEKGADVNTKARNGCTPLLRAVECCKHNFVEELILKYGAEVNNNDENVYSPLMRAAYLGFDDTVEVLLKNNADVNQESKYFKSALMQALIGYGKTKTIELLFKSGANVNASFPDGDTPLIAAIKGANIEIVEKLLKYGADPNLLNNFGETPLIVLAKLINYYDEIAKLLVKYGARFDIGNTEGTPVMKAARYGNIEKIKSFIKLGADINYQHNKRTVLLTAISWRQIETVKFLLSLGAIIPEGMALYEAVSSNSIEIINLLLERGADPMLIDEIHFKRLKHSIKKYPTSYTKVVGIVNKWSEQRKLKNIDKLNVTSSDNTITGKAFKAIEDNDISIIKHILHAGVDPNNLINEQGLTLLGQAGQSGRYKITEILLKNKADPNKYKGFYYAPITKALTFGHFNIAKLLLRYGADPTIEDCSGGNLLHIDKVFHNHEMLKLLLLSGANPNLEDQVFGTAFSMVVNYHSFSSLEMVKFFLAHGADPNLGSIKGDTLLLSAIKDNKEQLAILLLEQGASPLLTCFNTCLDEAIKRRKIKLGQKLIDTGAINLPPKDTITGILDSSIEYKDCDMVKFILSNFKELKLTAKNIEKGFTWAAANGELKILKQLMKHIIYLNSYDRSINISSALISLVKGKEPELEQYLYIEQNTATTINTIEDNNPHQNFH
ncbi:ankyrin repeat domain-containing protein [Candidatus Jidaibacter acanthamoebae]|nr:ankyrin repeat domain-containing protein [Candidatus Jidaibacter acanthamoeba]